VAAWYDAVGPATAAVAGVRLVALALAAWVVGAATLQLLLTWSTRPALRRLAEAVSPRALRRLAHGAAGLSLTVVLAGPPTPSDPAGTAVMEVLEATTTTTTDTTRPTAPTSTPTTAPAAVPAAAPTPGGAGRAPGAVVVAAGDSFWSLAVEAVGEGPGCVHDYWRRLIAANRARLVDPANPDLLYPGQVLRLPDPRP
jgi:nucleoid-associated protein YgaU